MTGNDIRQRFLDFFSLDPVRPNLAQIVCVPVEHRTSIVYALHDCWKVESGKKPTGRPIAPG